MATASNTLAAIVREVASRLYPGRIVTGATTSEVDSASILDNANLLDNDANANQYNKVWVRIDEFVTGGPSVGEAQRVRDAGYAGGTGDLTTEAFSASVNTSTDFSLHYTLKPSEVDDATNLVLTNTFHKAYHPLSIVANHDYEDAFASTNWEATNATITRTTAADVVPYGRNGQNVLLTSASGFSESEVINVDEGDVYFIWAAASADIGTATLVIRDITNGADISPDANTNEEAFLDLAYEFTIPSGCEVITVRLSGTSSSDDADWGPVVLFPRARKIFNLPRDMDYSSHVMGAFWFPLGQTSGDSVNDNAYRPFERHPRPIPYRPMFDPLQANHNRVELDLRGISGPVFIEGWRPFVSITSPSGSATADTTTMNHDTLIVGTLGECHKKIAARLDRTDPASALTHRRLQAEFESDFQSMLDTNDYAVPTTEVVPPRRVFVRLP